MTRPKMMYIKWLDHYLHNDGWGDADYTKCKDGLICETVGFLMYESKKCYHIASSLSVQGSTQTTSASVAILKCCVIKKRVLK